MDLQISVFLLFILFTAGHSLSCYECMSLTGSCADQKGKTCPSGSSQCMSSTVVAQVGDNSVKVKIKDCVPACLSGSMNFGIIKATISCCNSDQCNLQDAPEPNPNGKKCYYCDGKSCSKTVSCSGNEDHCIKATGHSLSCYECISVKGSCADQTVKTCPSGSSHCMSSTVVTPIGDNITEAKVKGCAPSYSCLYPSFSSADVSVFCCNTDLCNAKDAELSGDSSSNDVNVPNVSNVPNGKKCYYCSGNSCSNIMDCSGTEDRCFTATVAYGGQSVVAKSCLSKAVCDAATSNPNVASLSCCEGNLCNGAQSVSQSFLFLCCSLLSYFLLH